MYAAISEMFFVVLKLIDDDNGIVTLESWFNLKDLN